MMTSGKGRQRIACMLLVFMMVVSLWGGIRPAQAASTTDITAGSQQYYITSVMYSGRAINMYVDSMSDIKNKTTVNLYALDKSQTQRFTFTKNSKGNYLMIPAGSKYTVNVSALSAGTAVFAWENKAANNEYFIIEKTSDGYYTLRMENSTGLYLTATSNSKLTLKAKASDNSQKFAFHAYPEKATEPETTASPESVVEKAAEDASKAASDLAAVVRTDRQYYITSVKYPTKAVNMSVSANSKIKNKTAVNLYKTDKTETQRFTFSKNVYGQYLMVPLGTSYTVNISARKAGTAVFAWKNNANNNEYFIVEKASDGYFTFRLASKNSLYLTAEKGTKLTLRTKASDNSQKFAVHEYVITEPPKPTEPSTEPENPKKVIGESYLWPVPSMTSKARLSRGYSSGHHGQDISNGKNGANVVATKSGTVIKVSNSCNHHSILRNAKTTKNGDWVYNIKKGTVTLKNGKIITCSHMNDYGNCVIIKHSDGTRAIYGHLKQNSIKVKKGQAVKQGQVIAQIGDSGLSTGPHLHFELRNKSNKAFNNNNKDFNNGKNGIKYIYKVPAVSSK